MSIKRFGNAETREIQEIEQKYNLHLPTDYLKFLHECNGALCENYDAIKLKNFDEFIHLRALYGVLTGNEYEGIGIDHWMSQYGHELPDGTILIGDSIENGFIILLCSGEDSGVYYWDDTRYFECSNDESNTYFIADTFTEFISGII